MIRPITLASSLILIRVTPILIVAARHHVKANQWKGKTGKNFVEGELDVSYISGMAPGVQTLVANSNISAATESGEGFGAALLAFLVELNGRERLPHVLSMSLGSLSFGACDKVPQMLANKDTHT